MTIASCICIHKPEARGTQGLVHAYISGKSCVCIVTVMKPSIATHDHVYIHICTLLLTIIIEVIKSKC